jgi:RNA polymerase primary sigma factor
LTHFGPERVGPEIPARCTDGCPISAECPYFAPRIYVERNPGPWARDPVSLETPVGRDGESALGDLIEDRWVGSPVDAVIDTNVRDETANILKTLSPKEEKVIRLRFGIGCEREHTLEEIGQEFDVTRERIRQIEAKALRQLRSPERARHLRALLAAR